MLLFSFALFLSPMREKIHYVIFQCAPAWDIFGDLTYLFLTTQIFFERWIYYLSGEQGLTQMYLMKLNGSKVYIEYD